MSGHQRECNTDAQTSCRGNHMAYKLHILHKSADVFQRHHLGYLVSLVTKLVSNVNILVIVIHQQDLFWMDDGVFLVKQLRHNPGYMLLFAVLRGRRLSG